MFHDYKLTQREFDKASERGISKSTVKSRVYVLGWSVHEAITKPPHRAKHNFTGEQIERAKNNGISYQILYNRVIMRKWDIETAINTPILTPGKKLKRRWK